MLEMVRSPEGRNKNVVSPGALAVHADRDGVVEQHAGEFGTGELAALIGVEDLRAATFALKAGAWFRRARSFIS